MLAERSLAIIAANAAPQRVSEREARQYQHRIDLSGPPAKLGTMAEPHCHSPRGNHPPKNWGGPARSLKMACWASFGRNALRRPQNNALRCFNQSQKTPAPRGMPFSEDATIWHALRRLLANALKFQGEQAAAQCWQNAETTELKDRWQVAAQGRP